MSSTNFITAKGTPWGVVVSALVRAYGATNPEEARNLKFTDIDIVVSLNGKALDNTAHGIFVNLLNKEGNLSSLSDVRTRMEQLIRGIRGATAEVDPSSVACRVIDDAAARITEVDLAHLIHDYMSSRDYAEDTNFDRIHSNTAELENLLNQL